MSTVQISIIIPTLNRSIYLGELLDSLKKQKENSALTEIIVVDNGSTDQTKNVCIKAQKDLSHLQYYYNSEPGLLTGRHYGAELANGEILVFLDDDVILNDQYINGICETFKDSDVQLATGPSLPKYEIEPPNWLEYFWDKASDGKYCVWLSLLDLGKEIKAIDPNFVWGLNFCIRKKTLLALGGFHPDCIPASLQRFQGDGETGLTIKAIEKNYLALYNPKLQLFHQVTKDRLTLTYFKKRAFYQGVCNSFSNIRSHELNKNYKSPPFHYLNKLEIKFIHIIDG